MQDLFSVSKQKTEG